MSCSGCNKNYPIVNKKYNLCGECVFIKNHDGKTRAQVYGERSASRPKKVYQLPQSKKPIRQQTKKEAGVKSKLSELKTNIELEAVQNGEYYCKGCGISHVGLDKSHILSVKHFKHLELDKDNINLFCRTCHMAWESWIISKMGGLLTFEKDVNYIFQHSKEFFSKIITKIQEYLYWNPQGMQVKKFQNILKKYGEKVASDE